MSSLGFCAGGFQSELELQQEIEKNEVATQKCTLEHTPDIVKNLKLPPIQPCPNHAKQDCLNKRGATFDCATY